MSRTIRKFPSWKNNQNSKLGKRRAAKAVRHTEEMHGKGNFFKKVFSRYNIFDFKDTIYTKGEAIDLECRGLYKYHQMEGSGLNETTRNKKRIQRPDKSNS